MATSELHVTKQTCRNGVGQAYCNSMIVRNKISWLWLVLVVGLLTAARAHAFYNPQTGHWLNRDPIDERGGLNLYAFLHNNGLNYYDLLGDDINIISGGKTIGSIQIDNYSPYYENGRKWAGAILNATPNINDCETTCKTYKWRQHYTETYYTKDKSYNTKENVLDNSGRSKDWYHDDGVFIVSGMCSYHFSDFPGQFPPSEMDPLWPSNDPNHPAINKVTLSFKLDLVELQCGHSDDSSGGTVVGTVNWGFSYTEDKDENAIITLLDIK